MSESVSPVDVILAGLEERARQEPYRGCVSLLDAEAAVHATAQKYEAALARQGAMLDRCRDERLSWEDVEQHVGGSCHGPRDRGTPTHGPAGAGGNRDNEQEASTA